MAIRFIDTAFYKSPFVRSLKGPLKTLYSFIICECNGAGIWAKDLPIASTYIDFNVTEKDFQVFIETGKAVDLKDGKYFFPDFIEHQYPKGLSETNPAQKNFILELKKYKLIDDNLKVLESPFQGSYVIVKETVKVKVKEKEGSKNSKFVAPQLIDVINYFKEHGYPEDLAKRFFESYSVAEWVDTRGNAVKNWKQKALNVWFKDENRKKTDQLTPKNYTLDGIQ